MRQLAPRLAIVALLASGCASRRAPSPVIDERLLLALEEARALQHRADLHLDSGDLAAALGDVTSVLAIRFPDRAPEGEETRLDAYARLARLQLASGDEASALERVARGDREATRDSFYRAHLATVRGEIFEARAKRLAASDLAGAKAARREALADYQRSIEINRRVQALLLAEER